MSKVELCLGDCLEYMRDMDAGSVDAIITDPPYGIDYKTNYGPRHGANPMGRTNMPRVIGDKEPFDPVPFLVFPKAIFFGAEHFANLLPLGGQWLIWDKRCGVIPERTQGDCEIAWCSTKGVTRIVRHMWDGMIRDSERNVGRVHPTQKPIAVMEWIIERVTKEYDTIFDPFMGSGTTGVACVKLNRNFIGCEINTDYFKIAEQRIAQAQADLGQVARPLSNGLTQQNAF